MQTGAAILDSAEMLGRDSPDSGYAIGFAGEMRIWLRSALIALSLCIFVPLHLAYRVVHYGSPLPMLFLRLACWIIGGRVRVHGKPLKHDVFFMANHVTWFDIPVIGGFNGSAFVARSELKQTRALHWLARMNRTVFTERSEKMNIAAQVADLREAMADNWSVTIFPEGSVTDGQSLLPFKTSMISVLEPPPPGVKVQPAVIDYGPLAEWIAWIGIEDGLQNARRLFARRGSFAIDLYFLEPFALDRFPNRKLIAAEARRQIEARLIQSLGTPLRPYRFDIPSIGYAAPH